MNAVHALSIANPLLQSEDAQLQGEVEDLAALIARAGARLPTQVDCVVGTPGDGLLVATLIALHLNRGLSSLSDLLDGRTMATGHTRRHAALREKLGAEDACLVVTNLLGDGSSLRRARQQIAASGLAGRFTYLAVQGNPDVKDADIVLVPEDPLR